MAGRHVAISAGETVISPVIPYLRSKVAVLVSFHPCEASLRHPVLISNRFPAMFSTFSVLVTSLRRRKPSASAAFASESQEERAPVCSFFRVGARRADGNRLASRLKRLCAGATGQSTWGLSLSPELTVGMDAPRHRAHFPATGGLSRLFS